MTQQASPGPSLSVSFPFPAPLCPTSDFSLERLQSGPLPQPCPGPLCQGHHHPWGLSPSGCAQTSSSRPPAARGTVCAVPRPWLLPLDARGPLTPDLSSGLLHPCPPPVGAAALPGPSASSVSPAVPSAWTSGGDRRLMSPPSPALGLPSRPLRPLHPPSSHGPALMSIFCLCLRGESLSDCFWVRPVPLTWLVPAALLPLQPHGRGFLPSAWGCWALGVAFRAVGTEGRACSVSVWTQVSVPSGLCRAEAVGAHSAGRVREEAQLIQAADTPAGPGSWPVSFLLEPRSPRRRET